MGDFPTRFFVSQQPAAAGGWLAVEPRSTFNSRLCEKNVIVTICHHHKLHTLRNPLPGHCHRVPRNYTESSRSSGNSIVDEKVEEATINVGFWRMK